jgi:hypothetical protein
MGDRQNKETLNQTINPPSKQALEQAPNPHNDAKESNSVSTYEWEEGNFQSLWGVLPAIDSENLSWGKTTATWERNERNRIIDRGGYLPPKLKPESNLFVENDAQRIASGNIKAFGFKTGGKTTEK